MATREIIDKIHEVVAISKSEAVEIIALLAGQVAQVPVSGNQSGACPTINVVDFGVIKAKITLIVDSERK